MKTLGIALVVLCAASALTLAAPKTVRAQSHVQTVGTAQEVSGVCAEQHRVEFIVQQLEASLATADRPAPDVLYRPQPREMVRAELQVPAALWRSLVLEEGSSRPIDLRVPVALLATLNAEGWVQMP